MSGVLLALAGSSPQGVRVPLDGGSITNTSYDATVGVTTTYTFKSDGSIEGTNGFSGKWNDQIAAAVGDSYWVSGGGGWQRLNVNRSFSISRVQMGTTNASNSIQIATDSGGTNVVTSGTFLSEAIAATRCQSPLSHGNFSRSGGPSTDDYRAGVMFRNRSIVDPGAVQQYIGNSDWANYSQWYTAGAGSGLDPAHYARWSITSSTGSGSVSPTNGWDQGEWKNMAGDSQLMAVASSVGTYVANIAVDIAIDSGGTIIVTSGTYTLTSTKTS